MHTVNDTGIPKLNGFLICYMNKKEMDTVYTRLKDLKIPDVTILKAMNLLDMPYPWTIALICKDKKKVDELDNYLVDKNIDLGTMKEIYVGEPRIQEFFRMMLIDDTYEPGIVRIRAQECPVGGKNPIACQLCPFGHILECHHPMTCDQTRNTKKPCSHLSKYDIDEDAMYRDE